MRSAYLLTVLAAVACSGQTPGAETLDRAALRTGVPVAGGPAVIDRGSYVQVWHREADGRWLFSRELWNSTTLPGAQSTGP
jgi:hypothetical protein